MRSLMAMILLGAFARAARADCDVDAPCVRRPATFPTVVLAGKSAPERGCRYAVLYQCKKAPKDFARRAMADAGWTHADAAKKQALAMAWMTEVEGDNLATDNVVADDGKHPLDPPDAKVTSRGVTLRYWATEDDGALVRWRVRFDRHGTMVSRTAIDHRAAAVTSP